MVTVDEVLQAVAAARQAGEDRGAGVVDLQGEGPVVVVVGGGSSQAEAPFLALGFALCAARMGGSEWASRGWTQYCRRVISSW